MKSRVFELLFSLKDLCTMFCFWFNLYISIWNSSNKLKFLKLFDGFFLKESCFYNLHSWWRIDIFWSQFPIIPKFMMHQEEKKNGLGRLKWWRDCLTDPCSSEYNIKFWKIVRIKKVLISKWKTYSYLDAHFLSHHDSLKMSQNLQIY